MTDWQQRLRHDHLLSRNTNGAQRREDAFEALRAAPLTDGLATHALGLADLGKVAAAIINERGWTQKRMVDHATGAYCLHGALQVATRQTHPGDFPLLSQVFHARGHSMTWNDEVTRSKTEVIEALEREPVTDAELHRNFGPQWVEIVLAVRAYYAAADSQRRYFADLCAREVGRGGSVPSGSYPRALMHRAGCAVDVEAGRRTFNERSQQTMNISHLVHMISREPQFEPGQYYSGGLVSEVMTVALQALCLRDQLVTEAAPGVAHAYEMFTATWRHVFGPLHLGDDRRIETLPEADLPKLRDGMDRLRDFAQPGDFEPRRPSPFTSFADDPNYQKWVDTFQAKVSFELPTYVGDGKWLKLDELLNAEAAPSPDPLFQAVKRSPGQAFTVSDVTITHHTAP